MSQDLNIDVIVTTLKDSNVKFAGIFGSHSRDEANEDSDVDILVSFSEPVSLFKLVRLERELSEVSKKEIDLVTEDSLSPYIKDDVLNNLQVIYGQR